MLAHVSRTSTMLKTERQRKLELESSYGSHEKGVVFRAGVPHNEGYEPQREEEDAEINDQGRVFPVNESTNNNLRGK
jgi:hypothetical protein